ncbi:hypothetical protein BDZ89DRAFT_1135820 [Hymenopellis radicata]|nr:hypothetical protein BDZ89DRAFT_1135820 [Hymenopellis radicata]
MASVSLSQRSQRTKRTWSREQLLRHLELFSDFSEHILPNLPPSPPASRSSSPALGQKRKQDTTFTQEHPKRPRTDSQSTRSSHQPSIPPPQPAPSATSRHNRNPNAFTATRMEPSEEGEVREDLPLPPPPPPPSAAPTTSAELDGAVDFRMPVRRPKQGRPSLRHFDLIHDRYYTAGRQLKYSGDARFWSTFPSSHREYRSLSNPPPANSSYHKYGGLIARLELVDALICFTYALWNKDYSRRCCIVDSWTTTTAFLTWCKTKWQAAEASTEGEKALLGLIFMIEGFIHARKLAYHHRNLNVEVDKIIDKARNEVVANIAMLPSPASIAPTSSANSTPTSRDGDTPNPDTSSVLAAPPAQAAPGPAPHIRMVPTKYTRSIPPHVANSVNSVTVPVSANMLGSIKDHMSIMSATIAAFNSAQQTLTLPTLQKYFPKTFARMMYSTLSPTDEHEVDIEDDEGELFWPGQSTNGEGLGWVCLMGQAMLREFGKTYGYKGLAGVVPKPAPEALESVSRSISRGGASGSTPRGSTPGGHTPTVSR